LIDGRHFPDVIDVMAWRGANIDSDHMLVVIKLGARICKNMRGANIDSDHMLVAELLKNGGSNLT
jgi:hypothetical protein